MTIGRGRKHPLGKEIREKRERRVFAGRAGTGPRGHEGSKATRHAAVVGQDAVF